MMPIHELLDRIRWDEAFGNAEFVIGFYDRVADRIQRVPLDRIQFVEGDHYFFHFFDDEGVEHSVPLHRIREVVRNGERIWHRE